MCVWMSGMFCSVVGLRLVGARARHVRLLVERGQLRCRPREGAVVNSKSILCVFELRAADDRVKFVIGDASVRNRSSAVTGVHFPYGVSDFASIRRSGEFFADNSAYIRTVENTGKHLIFTRPPRWGKSLFVDMMSVYYDKNTSESEFEELFGGLDIGKSPTAEAQSFCVLPIDLTVNVDTEMPVDVIEQGLHNCINQSVEDFVFKYGLPERVIKKNALQSLQAVRAATERNGDTLYVMIDVYDRVANKLMLGNPNRCPGLVDRKMAPLIGVLEMVKVIKPARTFITGITTMTIADEINSFTNASTQPHLGSMLGFTEGHLRRALAIIQLEPELAESALELMREYFNGYRFHGTPDETLLYNPQQCLYFFRKLALGSMGHLLSDDAWKTMKAKDVIDCVIMEENRWMCFLSFTR